MQTGVSAKNCGTLTSLSPHFSCAHPLSCPRHNNDTKSVCYPLLQPYIVMSSPFSHRSVRDNRLTAASPASMRTSRLQHFPTWYDFKASLFQLITDLPFVSSTQSIPSRETLASFPRFSRSICCHPEVSLSLCVHDTQFLTRRLERGSLEAYPSVRHSRHELKLVSHSLRSFESTLDSPSHSRRYDSKAIFKCTLRHPSVSTSLNHSVSTTAIRLFDYRFECVWHMFLSRG